jgi:hypothetical protein
MAPSSGLPSSRGWAEAEFTSFLPYRPMRETETWQGVPYIPPGQYFVPAAYRASLACIVRGNPVFWNVRRS